MVVWRLRKNISQLALMHAQKARFSNLPALPIRTSAAANLMIDVRCSNRLVGIKTLQVPTLIRTSGGYPANRGRSHVGHAIRREMLYLTMVRAALDRPS
jgi:hypothetical protein